MSLEIEYERPYPESEPENLGKNIIKYVPYNIKSMYPGKKKHSLLENHVKEFVPYIGECE